MIETIRRKGSSIRYQLLIAVLMMSGCSSIGNNVGVALNDKRLIRDFYAVEEPSNPYFVGNEAPWYFIYGADSKDQADEISKKDERLCQEDGNYLSSNEKAEVRRLKQGNPSYCDRHNAYKKEISKLELKKAKHAHRKVEREFALIANKISNYPYAVTDPYDIRAREPIRAGEPLSIIINKVHLKGNRESFLYEIDHAEIAVVVSVNDGSGENKDVLVAYETNIDDGVNLPISNLLAFYTDSYQDEPIRISVTVFEFDQFENQLLNGLLSSAVSTAAAENPALAVPGSLAEQLGSYLISTNSDDVITKFTFQVYPWKENQIFNKSLGIGVPVVAHGQTVIFNTDDANEIIDRKLIHMTYGLDIMEYSKGDITNEVVLALQNKVRTDEVTGLKQFPSVLDPMVENLEPLPSARTHLILTIDNRYMNHAAEVVKLANDLALKASGFDLGSLNKDKIKDLQSSLNKLEQIDRLTSHFKSFTERGYTTSAYIELVEQLTCIDYSADNNPTDCTEITSANLAKLEGRLSNYFAKIETEKAKSCRSNPLSKDCVDFIKANLNKLSYDRTEGIYKMTDSD